MIQRIQTLYLLVSTLFIGLMLLFSYPDKVQDGVVSFMIGLIMTIQAFVIFNYKNRKWQIRVTRISMILLILLAGSCLYFTYFSNSGTPQGFKISTVFPLVAIILDYLAFLAIQKDEALIRSIDRIR
jgi:heme/copper-type cytochrome/quinol oxidase subunit 4